MSLNKATHRTRVHFTFSDKTVQYEPVITQIHDPHVSNRIANFMPNKIYWKTGLFCPCGHCEVHPSLLKDTELDYASSQPPHC